jgi:hypothetical protein
MDIDLETCFLAFLIGFALYLLVNRVFMVEGLDFNVEDQATCQAACDTMNQNLRCEWMPNCEGIGCNIGDFDQNCRACSDTHPCSSSSPPTKPLTPSLTPDELKLKNIIEQAIHDSDDEDKSITSDPDPLGSDYNFIVADIVADILSELPDHSVVGLSLHFENADEMADFKKLLQKNTNKSLINSNGKPIILKFLGYSYTRPDNGWEFVSIDLSYAVSIANCFNGNIIGMVSVNGFEGDLSALSGLKNSAGLQFFTLADEDKSYSNIQGNLSDLSGLEELRFLDFASTPSINGDLSALSGLKKLRFLRATDAPGIKGGLSALSGLEELRVLDFDSTPSINGDLSALSGLKKLRVLDLTPTHNRESHPGVSRNINGSLSDLSLLEDLIYVDLGETAVEGNLSALSHLTGLRYLDLDDTAVEGNLSELSDLNQLKYLDLTPTHNRESHPGVSRNINGSLSDLSNLTKLEDVYLCPNDISGNVFDYPNLTNIYMKDQSEDYNNDFDECGGITGVLEVDCSSERFNCKCGDEEITCRQ